jgi:hypothetical protein
VTQAGTILLLLVGVIISAGGTIALAVESLAWFLNQERFLGAAVMVAALAAAFLCVWLSFELYRLAVPG